MEAQEIVLDGRKYKAYISPDEQSGAAIIIGPTEGLVDSLGLPVEVATRLHNILYERGILTYLDASKKHKEVSGALQELYQVDVQRLVEAYYKIEKGVLT